MKSLYYDLHRLQTQLSHMNMKSLSTSLLPYSKITRDISGYTGFFFITETSVKPGCTRTFCALQPDLKLKSLVLVATTAGNQKFQKVFEDLGSVNVTVVFAFRNL